MIWISKKKKLTDANQDVIYANKTQQVQIMQSKKNKSSPVLQLELLRFLLNLSKNKKK